MPTQTVPPPLYITLRLDVLSNVLKTLAEAQHQAYLGISVHEVRLLLLVRENPGLSVQRLVDLSFMEKTKVSKMLTGLCQSGHVQRTPSQHDARQMALGLTPKGRRAALAAHRFVLDATRSLLSVLPPEHAPIFEECLGTLTAHALHMQACGQGLTPYPKQRRRSAPPATPG